MHSAAQKEAISGARAIAPLAIGVAAYGLAFGLLASQAGFNWAETGLMGVLVFAGSSQIVAVERLAAGAGIAAAFIAGVALNLRLLLITASVRSYFMGRPLWQRLLGAHLSADENWALTLAERSQGKDVGYWFLVGAGLTLVVVWVMTGVLGVLFAASIPDPEEYALDFAFTAAFIAIARALWRGRSDLLPWVTAIAVVAMTTRLEWFDASWSIVLGGVSGAVAAAVKPNV
ncbi:MAG TPA: AzlC family ABC transporter permease [Gammaproteobacteria bacterium]|nr:AzlC family ABC transporter permease [Gammaproteobacteria bacterium]